MSDIPKHEHTGLDSPKIKFINLEDIRIDTSTPTDAAPEGTIRIVDAGTGTAMIYVRSNKTWKQT